MAIVVTPNLTDISMCDSVTGWADVMEQFALETGVKVQNTGSLSGWIDATTSAIEYYTITSANMSNGEHVYIWMFCSGVVDTKALGGYRIVLYTDSSNYATFYTGGNDTHGTGWQLMVCDDSSTPDDETGTFDPADVTRVGVQFKTLTNAVKKGQTYINNCFWDAMRYGTGLTITSGATDAVDLEDIFVVDDNSAYKYGVVTKSFGAYIIQGKLIFGDGTGTDNVDFEDSNQVVLFPDNDKVATDFYGIEVVGNATGATNFTLGEESGGAGVSGCTIKSVGSQVFSFDVSDADNDVIGLYGSAFINAGAITLPAYDADKEMLSCNFEGCDQIDVNDGTVTHCNFIASTDITGGAVLINQTDHRTTYCNFINNTYAVEIDVASVSYAMDNMLFSGNVTDINNTSGGQVTIGAVDSDPSSYTGSTTINNSVWLRVYIRDKNNDPIAAVSVAMYKSSDHTELMNEDSAVATGLAEEAYNYGGDTPIYWRARESPVAGTRYVANSGVGTIDNTGLTMTVVMEEEPLT